MSDGHSGIKNEQINQGGPGRVRLTLSFLKQGSGFTEFVIHATASSSLYREPFEFLARSGFTHFRGDCPFHRELCFFRVIAELHQNSYGILDEDRVQGIHESFRRFSERIDELYQIYQREKEILGGIGIDAEGHCLFGLPTRIEIDPTAIPSWVNDLKFPELREREKQVASIQHEIDDLTAFLPLLYGTGEILEESVIQSLRFLNLKAERAEKGFTADILARTIDGSRRFGFEVTGIAGAVKKESKKLTQLIEFERIKENREKAILIATTHNTTPIKDRNNLEDFTPQVIGFFTPFPILLMTGFNLYSMIGDVLEGNKTKEQIIEILFATNGKLDYAS